MKALYFSELEPEIDPAVFGNLLEAVSHEKRNRIGRLRHDADKKLSLYAEILLRCLICKALGIKNSHIEFSRDITGKPVLKSHPCIHFNVSHTKNALAVGISGEPVGVDIERIRPFNLRIAERFFTEQELNWIKDSEEDRDIRFFTVWTKKEAALKRTGTGIADIRTVDTFRDGFKELLDTFRVKSYLISVCSAESFEISDLTCISEADIPAMRDRYIC